MTAHNAYIKLTFSVELPDDPNEADGAFDQVTEWVENVLNTATTGDAALKAIYPQSFGIDDADTTDEL